MTDPQTWNGYSYVSNSPLSFTDPSGEGILGDILGFIGDLLGGWLFGGFGGGGGFGGLPNIGGANSGPWNEQPPISTTVGVLNTGGIFGGGNTGPFIFSLAEQIGEDADGIVDGVSDAVTSLGLGIRQQGQTFKGCMVANANDYSVNGILRVGFNIAGIDAKILSHPVVNAIVGNPVNTILFGTGGETAASGLGMVPGFIQRGIGTATTYGRRTTTLMALNFAARGGVPIALSQASKGAASFFGRFSKELGFGLDFAATLAVNVGITGAEAINCMGVRK